MKYVSSFVVLLALLFSPINPTYSTSLKVEKKEKIIGTVIAQYKYDFLLCIYHPCAIRLIVRVKDKARKPSYALVIVEYFPENFPKELVERAKGWQFETVRDTNQRLINSEFRQTMSKERDTSDWKLLPGAENETIPVGEYLPSYFVKSGKYKANRK